MITSYDRNPKTSAVVSLSTPQMFFESFLTTRKCPECRPQGVNHEPSRVRPPAVTAVTVPERLLLPEGPLQ